MDMVVSAFGIPKWIGDKIQNRTDSATDRHRSGGENCQTLVDGR